MTNKDYILGTSDPELDRLRRQDEVWAEVTETLLDRLGDVSRAHVLDVGCGPGLVSARWRRRVSDRGRVTRCDLSWRMVHAMRDRHEGRDLAMRASVLALPFADATFDIVYARWVLTFIADLDVAIAETKRVLRPGGALVVQDYNHDGVSFFPRSRAFDAVLDATRRSYREHGGDPWVGAALPQRFAQVDLAIEHQDARCLFGPPGSPVWNWMRDFFVPFSQNLVAMGFLSVDDREAYLADVARFERDGEGICFSPLVLEFVARRAATA